MGICNSSMGLQSTVPQADVYIVLQGRWNALHQIVIGEQPSPFDPTLQLSFDLGQERTCEAEYQPTLMHMDD